MVGDVDLDRVSVEKGRSESEENLALLSFTKRFIFIANNYVFPYGLNTIAKRKTNSLVK